MPAPAGNPAFGVEDNVVPAADTAWQDLGSEGPGGRGAGGHPAPRGDSDEPETERLHRTLEGFLGVPFTSGNSVEVLRNGIMIFPAMLEAIARAEREIQMVTFIYWRGKVAEEFAHALASRARAGVRVQLLLDAVGSMPLRRTLIRIMEDAGVIVRWFRPPVRWKIWKADHRTHRKVLVCDGRVGFTGGVGIASQWEGDARHAEERRDTHFRIEGPAIRGLQAAFLFNWLEAYDHAIAEEPCIVPVQEAGDTRVQVIRSAATAGWSEVTTLQRLCVRLAREQLDIATAYFVPDSVMRRMLKEARERGVRIRVLVPGTHMDHRYVQLASHRVFSELVEAGIEIYTYERSMMHAKIMIVDDRLASVGSPNFDQRARSKDEEVALNILDPEVVQILHGHFEEDLDLAKPIDLRHWRRRPLGLRALEVIANRFRGEF